MLKSLSRIDLLILDDWGLSVLTQAQRIDLLEILEDRNGHGATIITSQVPVEQWHEVIGDPTLADACLDRLVHNAHRLNPPETVCAESGASARLTPTKKLSINSHVGQAHPAHLRLNSLPAITRNQRPRSAKCAARPKSPPLRRPRQPRCSADLLRPLKQNQSLGRLIPPQSAKIG